MNAKPVGGYRQVGNFPPDLAAPEQGELEERRKTVARLQDLVGKADKGEEGAVPALPTRSRTKAPTSPGT